MIPLPQERRFLTPDQYTGLLRSGMVLSVRGGIVGGADPPYGHSALLACDGLFPTVIQTDAPEGYSETPLAEWLKSHADVDVSTVHGAIDAQKCLAKARSFAGDSYGWLDCFLAGLMVAYRWLTGRRPPPKAILPECADIVLRSLKAGCFTPWTWNTLPSLGVAVSPSQLAGCTDYQWSPAQS